MAKVDTDRFIALLIETFCDRQGIDRRYVQTYMDEVLEKMGFKVENGEIVELKSKVPDVFKEIDRPLNDFPLSVRTLVILRMNGITTVRELVRLHKTEVRRFRNAGGKTISELTDFIESHHLQWGMDV